MTNARKHMRVSAKKAKRGSQRRRKRVLVPSQRVSLADVDRLVGDKLAERDKKALMRIPAPPAQPWKLSTEEVDLVRNHIAKGASDAELQFCLAVARRYKLDPFRQQIWFVPRNDKGVVGGKRWIPITGINGLLHIAARDHKDFGSNDEPEFGPMKEIKWTYFEKSGKLMAPEWAKVTLWKKGHSHPIVATVFWDEIYPDVGAAPLVKQMPRLMLGKCALAQAIRRAYPATDGLYISEEFQGPAEFTESGRAVEVLAPKKELDCTFCGKLDAPEGCAEPSCPIRRDKNYLKLLPEQKAVVDKALAGRKTSREEGPAKESGAVNNPISIPPAPDFLHYELTPSGSYFIDGPEPIKKANRDILAPLYVHPTGIMATPGQLGKLISEFERRKVPFRDVTPQDRQPGE